MAKIKGYLDVPQGTVQDTEVGRLFLILGGRQLPLQQLEAFLQMRSAVFFQLVVNLARASPTTRRTYLVTLFHQLLYHNLTQRATHTRFWYSL